MAKAESLLKHSNLSYMLRDHKKKILSSRDKLLLGCDVEASAAEVVDLNELEENDIWVAMDNQFDLHQDHEVEGFESYYSSASSRSGYSSKASPQDIEFHSGRSGGGGNSSGKLLLRQQSAPMNVPDWSKILGSSANSSRRHNSFDDESDESDEEPMEDHHHRRLPPHEVVARDYARSHSVAFSVHEGAGHTLKGRDLSRVRNAVLKQTGFFD